MTREAARELNRQQRESARINRILASQ